VATLILNCGSRLKSRGSLIFGAASAALAAVFGENHQDYDRSVVGGGMGTLDACDINDKAAISGGLVTA
jgi:hypothetical protein